MATTPWKTLKSQRLTPEQQVEVAAEVRTRLAEMPLQELRQAREFIQTTLAEAMGGQLEIIARFPDGAVRVTQFASEVGTPT